MTAPLPPSQRGRSSNSDLEHEHPIAEGAQSLKADCPYRRVQRHGQMRCDAPILAGYPQTAKKHLALTSLEPNQNEVRHRSQESQPGDDVDIDRSRPASTIAAKDLAR